MDSDYSMVKNINNLLNLPQTRISGLQILAEYLPHCSDENFLEFCINWMQNCCKTDINSKNLNDTIKLLDSLLRISSNYPELNKSVSFFITNRFFDHFFKYFVNCSAGWSCAKTCFLFYRGCCGPSQEVIEKHLLQIVQKSAKISSDVSECVALLPSLGGGGNEGINYQTNWKNQFFKLIHIGHSIFNDLFVNIEELQEYDTTGYKYSTKEKHPSLETLSILLHNYCSVLNSMLVCTYPAQKCIPVDLLLGFICRGLAVNPLTIGKNKTIALKKLEVVLPQIHIVLLDLLNSLLVTCGNQLLPYAFIVGKLIKQTLEWTQSDSSYGKEKNFGLLRIFAYDTMSNWLVATKSGNGIDKFSNLIISHIISDIEFKKANILLKEKKSKENNPKSKQQTSQRIDSTANCGLCYGALKALQYVLKYSGVLLKIEDHKFLQETIVKLLVSIQNSFVTETIVPYSVENCRKELYCVLLELVTQSCPKWPPPSHYAIRLFKKGEYDSCPEIAQFCSFALNTLTVILHQQYSNGPLSISEKSYDQLNETESSTEKNSFIEDVEMSFKNTATEEEEVKSDNECNDSNENDFIKEDNKIKSNQSDYGRLSNVQEVEKSPKTRGQEKNSFCENKISEEITVLEDKGSFNEKHVAVIEDNSKNESYGEPKRKKSKILENTSLSNSSPVNVSQSLDIQKPKIKEIEVVEIENVEKENVEVENVEIENVEKENVEVENVEVENVEVEIEVENSKEPFSADKNSKSSEKRKSPRKHIEGSASEDSFSEKSATPELLQHENGKSVDFKKRYFLRSKTGKSSSEEPEEILRRTDSLESLKNTPSRGTGKHNTPASSTGLLRRPRTRAISKLQLDESESDRSTPTKISHDEDDDIIQTFDDSFVE